MGQCPITGDLIINSELQRLDQIVQGEKTVKRKRKEICSIIKIWRDIIDRRRSFFILYPFQLPRHRLCRKEPYDYVHCYFYLKNGIAIHYLHVDTGIRPLIAINPNHNLSTSTPTTIQQQEADLMTSIQSYCTAAIAALTDLIKVTTGEKQTLLQQCLTLFNQPFQWPSEENINHNILKSIQNLTEININISVITLMLQQDNRTIDPPTKSSISQIISSFTGAFQIEVNDLE